MVIKAFLACGPKNVKQIKIAREAGSRGGGDRFGNLGDLLFANSHLFFFCHLV